MADTGGHHERHAAGAADAQDRRTRRRVLAGTAGVLGAAAATVLGTAAPAEADNGAAVLQGTDNGFPTTRTAVLTIGSNEAGILADPNASGKGSLGVYGIGQDAGVRGEAGGNSNGDGVDGFGSGLGSGVFGQGGVNNGIGVFGQGGGSGPGVVGQSDNGTGVQGQAQFSTGTGVWAINSGGGVALRVEGTSSFDTSGVLTVRAGRSSATQTRVLLNKTSLVLVTLQQHEAGVWVLAAVPDVSRQSFTVYLSKAVAAHSRVAWFIIN